MKKRFLVAMGMLFVAGSGFLLTNEARAGIYSYNIPFASIQEKVDQHIPYTKSGLILHSLKVSGAENVMTADVDGNYDMVVIHHKFQAHSTFGMTYHDGSFYLTNFHVISAVIDGKPAVLSQHQNARMSLEHALNHMMKNIPVYTLDSNSLKGTAIQGTLESIAVHSDHITAELGP
mgnify:CR=1 FL=1